MGGKGHRLERNSRVADGKLGQGKDGAAICTPGGPEVVHYLSHGGPELDCDRPRHLVGFTELSQTEASVFKDDHEPFTAREDGEEVDGLVDDDFGDFSGWGVMATPETVKAGLADCLLSKRLRGGVDEVWTILVKEWHAGAYAFELFEPNTSVVGDEVESLASLFGGESAGVPRVGGDGRYRGEADEVFYGQFVEDQKQDVNREIQQGETLHGGWEDGTGDQSM
jgi:hypothetical protein